MDLQGSERNHVEIIRDIPPDKVDEVVDILYEAFGDKFEVVFGCREGAGELIRSCLRPDRAVLAVERGRVIGIAGLNYGGRESLDMSIWQLIRNLKAGALRAALLGGAFEHDPEDGEMIVDMLAVRREFRGRGIGRRLLEWVACFAKGRGYARLRLHVTDSNHRAKRFYERAGFREDGYEGLGYLSRFYDFDGGYRMIRDLR